MARKKIKYPIIDGKAVISGVEDLESFAFYKNRELVTVVLEDGVKCIRMDAFCACPNLTTVVLPATLEVILEGAFASCVNLKRIFIPKGVRRIYENAFALCGNLEIFCEGEVGSGWTDYEEVYTTTVYSDEDDAFNFHRSSGSWNGHTVEQKRRIRWNPDNRPVHTNVTYEQYLKLCEN